MKSLPIRKFECIFSALSVVHIFIQYMYNVNYVTYIIYLFIILETYLKKIDRQEFLLYSLFIPNKYLQIISIPIYLGGDLFKPKFTRKAWLFLGGITTFGLINCAVYKGMLIETFFQIGFYYCILLLIQHFCDNDKVTTYMHLFDYIFILQIVCASMEILVFGGIKDNVRGTFQSAHYFGIYLLIYIYMQFKFNNQNRKQGKTAFFCIIGIVFFVLADAKHVFFIMLLTYIMVIIFNKLHIQRQVTLIGLALLIGVPLGIIFSQLDVGKNIIENSYIRPYLYDEKYNKKYVYLVNTYENMQSISGVIGFGVGQYGSQISITMSKGIIYEWNPNLTAYRYAIEPYKKAVSNLMTEKYTNIDINESSMVLGYPLVSFVSMVAELGIVWFLLLCSVLDSYYKDKDKIFIIGFVLLTFFDTYLEIACVFVLILFVTSMFQKGENILIE